MPDDLATLTTPQQWFDRVWRWFVVDRHPPSVVFDDEGEYLCVYNGKHGTRCAFAALLTDTELERIATHKLEGKSATTVIDELRLERFGDYRIFCDKLQRCHDDAATGRPEDFTRGIRDKLADLAKKHYLTIPGDDDARSG